jgi:hypothetical protein|tara:strand:+ start:179 stop:448 length:270 start_codon:yes stop_codon:yes gene_type:complete
MNIKLSKQQQRVIDFVKHNNYHINPLESWNKCGVYRLSAVIHELRKKGYGIDTYDKKVQNQYGETCTVGEYYFQESKDWSNFREGVRDE